MIICSRVNLFQYRLGLGGLDGLVPYSIIQQVFQFEISWDEILRYLYKTSWYYIWDVNM